LRKFIMEGGNAQQFFHSSGRTFVSPSGELPDGRVVVPTHWCHILAADETAEVAVVYVRLFLGPKALSWPHYITLGPLGTKIVIPGCCWSHVYVYYQEQRETGLAGRVETASITRLR
jgi:hypothetical protein